MNIAFKEKLLAGSPLVGTLATLPSPEMAEFLAKSGFDWLFIDAEHSAMNTETVQRMLQAAQPHCPCLVRVPAHDQVWIKKVLDMGPEGIIIPLVNTPEQARDLAALCQYPPQGQRSVGMGRAHTYGMGFAEYLSQANQGTAVVFQVEHIQAVQNVEEICQTDGLDAVFVGPFDLSASMGRTGQVSAPEVTEAIDRALDAARAAGKPAGIFAADAGTVVTYKKKGFTLLAVGTDTLFTTLGAQSALAAARAG